MLKITNCLIKEVVIWYTIPLLFLLIYIGQYHNPIHAAYSHLYAITLIALVALLLKFIFYILIRKQALALLLSSLLYATILFSLIVYYCLVIVGLRSWGKVISEELIFSYALQAQQLCDAAGFSYSLAVTIFITSFFLVTMGCYFALKKTCHPRKIASPALISILLLSLASLIITQLINNYSYANLPINEPFNLTLFSGKPSSSSKNSHQILANINLDKQEDNARAQYKVLATADQKNVILIIVDALRPDHMGVYGYHLETTPYLSSIAKQGRITLLNKAHASCGESACGLSSIVSSKYVHQQPSNPFTLQQVLQRYDYKINMILGGDHTNFYNLRDLYGKVDSYFDGSMAKGYYMNDDTFVIDKVKALTEWNNKPTMFQFHLMSAHTIGKRQTLFSKFQPHKSYAHHMSGKPEQQYTNHYDNGVLQADAVIHELITLLQTKKYLKNALVVITADHGESLGEHQLFSHANSVQEELLRTPLLIIDFADNSPLSIKAPSFISQVDISPTILHELKMAIPTSWYGHPIQLNDVQNKKDDFTFFQLLPNIGLYDHRQPNKLFKYWVNIQTGEEYAFDLSVDAKEQHNIIWQVPAELKYEWRKTAYATQLH